MIPSFNQSGVLPPFTSDGEATDSAVRAPYKTSIFEVSQLLSTNSDRVSILKGLIEYRSKLRDFGIKEGFQWLDGSFVENCEINKNRPPNDIDVVTFFRYPEDFNEEKFMDELLDTKQLKEKYSCDGYYVNIDNHPIRLIKETCYWFGLFTHQRQTFVWKGILEIPLHDFENDSKAIQFLQESR